jgi:hypothetical protein
MNLYLFLVFLNILYIIMVNYPLFSSCIIYQNFQLGLIQLHTYMIIAQTIEISFVSINIFALILS